MSRLRHGRPADANRIRAAPRTDVGQRCCRRTAHCRIAAYFWKEPSPSSGENPMSEKLGHHCDVAVAFWRLSLRRCSRCGLRRVPFWVVPSSMRCFIGFLRIIGELPPSREAVPGLPIRQQDGRRSTEFRSCDESIAARRASHAKQTTEGELANQKRSTPQLSALESVTAGRASHAEQATEGKLVNQRRSAPRSSALVSRALCTGSSERACHRTWQMVEPRRSAHSR